VSFEAGQQMLQYRLIVPRIGEGGIVAMGRLPAVADVAEENR